MNDVKAATGIGDAVVQRRRQCFVLKSQQTAGQFDRSRTVIKVTEVTLQCRYRNPSRGVTESPVIASRFDDIVALGALAVSVDMANLVRPDVRSPQGGLNGSSNATPVCSIRVT